MEFLDISASENVESSKGSADGELGIQDKAEPKTEERETLSKPATKSQEDIARKAGWKPQEEWSDEDPNTPNDFISAELFNERGKRIESNKAYQKRMSEQEASFNDRIDNLTKLHNIQIDAQKKELERKRTEAIEDADLDAANSIQEDIDNLNSAPEHTPASVNPDQHLLDDFNQRNPWVTSNSPKAAYAKSQFNLYGGQNMSVQGALDAVERDVAREFPEVNQGRAREPASEGGSPPGKKASAKALSMSDLTAEEAKWRTAMPGAWKNDKEFLQAVSDNRSVEK